MFPFKHMREKKEGEGKSRVRNTRGIFAYRAGILTGVLRDSVRSKQRGWKVDTYLLQNCSAPNHAAAYKWVKVSHDA